MRLAALILLVFEIILIIGGVNNGKLFDLLHATGFREMYKLIMIFAPGAVGLVMLCLSWDNGKKNKRKRKNSKADSSFGEEDEPW